MKKKIKRLPKFTFRDDVYDGMDELKRLLAVEKKQGQKVVDTILEAVTKYYNEKKLTIKNICDVSSRWDDNKTANVKAIIRDIVNEEALKALACSGVKDLEVCFLIEKYINLEKIKELICNLVSLEIYPPAENQTYLLPIMPRLNGDKIELIEDLSEVQTIEVGILKSKTPKELLETESNFVRLYDQAVSHINKECERIEGGCDTTKEHNDRRYLFNALFEEAKARGKAIDLFHNSSESDAFKIITVGDKRRFLADIAQMIKEMIRLKCSLAQRKRFRESLAKYLISLDRITFSVQCNELENLIREEEQNESKEM